MRLPGLCCLFAKYLAGGWGRVCGRDYVEGEVVVWCSAVVLGCDVLCVCRYQANHGHHVRFGFLQLFQVSLSLLSHSVEAA